MTYNKTTWENRVPPRINATKLNKIEIGIEDAHEMATGRCATLVVAASDSSALSKQQADYVCDGTDDQVEIQAAIDALPAGGGKIVLLDGGYVISDAISMNSYIWMEGQGYNTSISRTGGIIVVTSKTHVTISNLNLDSNNAGHVIDVTDSSFIKIQNNYLTCAADDVITVATTSHSIISDNFIETSGSVGGWVSSGIELEDGCEHITVSNNVIKDIYEIGIHVHVHAASPVCSHITISGNVIDTVTDLGSGGTGIIISGATGLLSTDITVVGNTIYNCNEHGINVRYAQDIILSGNSISTCASGIYMSNSKRISINANNITNCVAGIDESQSSLNEKIVVVGNTLSAMSHRGIAISCDEGVIANNIIDDANYGIRLYSASSKTRVVNNAISNSYTYIHDVGTKNIIYNNYIDILMDVLAVSTTHVRSNEDLSAATPITFTIDAQPDVPRTLSWSFDSHAQITEYDMEVIGVDAKGNTVTETWDETAGWSGETSNAFATITSIKMMSRTGTGVADTMDIGITDVLGLSNVICATSDVFKIKKNNANATVAGAQVNTTYDTYDMSVIGLGAADDFTIWYKSNLNIIS